MPRMSKKRRLEWSFFLRQVKVGNTTCDRITYNDLCRGCTHSCKQSFRAVIILCPRYYTPNAGKRRTGTMADNRKYYYLKLKENFFDSDSIVLLEDMKDGILYSNILLKLYLKSLKNGGKLQLDEHIPYTAQVIATLTRHQIGTVERALEIFRQLGLVEQLDSGAFYMTDIELMIGQSSTEAERKTGCKAGKQGTFTAPDKRRTFVRHSSTRDRVRERDRDRKRERGRNGTPRPRRLWQIQQCDTDRYRAFRAENRTARQVGVLY